MRGSRLDCHATWLCRLQTLLSKLKRYADDIVHQLDDLINYLKSVNFYVYLCVKFDTQAGIRILFFGSMNGLI
jgi:transcription initiation factor IIE alpha subunit